MSEKVHEPMTKDKIEYTSSEFIMTDFANNFKSMYVFASRVRQFMDLNSGKMPQEGEEIKIKFKNQKWMPYKVVDVNNNFELTYKSQDKYHLVCKKSFSSMEYDDADDYPNEIVIGYRSGTFAQ